MSFYLGHLFHVLPAGGGRGNEEGESVAVQNIAQLEKIEVLYLPNSNIFVHLRFLRHGVGDWEDVS